jgi:hypothetical protein
MAKIAESLEGEISVEPEWLSEHVSALGEDRVEVDPALWAQVAGFLERREAFRADYQTFPGKLSPYELHPFHLLAYHGTRTCWRSTQPTAGSGPSPPCPDSARSRVPGGHSSGRRASMPAAMPGRLSASPAGRGP